MIVYTHTGLVVFRGQKLVQCLPFLTEVHCQLHLYVDLGHTKNWKVNCQKHREKNRQSIERTADRYSGSRDVSCDGSKNMERQKKKDQKRWKNKWIEYGVHTRAGSFVRSFVCTRSTITLRSTTTLPALSGLLVARENTFSAGRRHVCRDYVYLDYAKLSNFRGQRLIIVNDNNSIAINVCYLMRSATS